MGIGLDLSECAATGIKENLEFMAGVYKIENNNEFSDYMKSLGYTKENLKINMQEEEYNLIRNSYGINAYTDDTLIKKFIDITSFLLGKFVISIIPKSCAIAFISSSLNLYMKLLQILIKLYLKCFEYLKISSQLRKSKIYE